MIYDMTSMYMLEFELLRCKTAVSANLH